VSRRTRNIVLAVVAIAILVWIVGYTLFNIGGTVPGSGEGDVITGLTTP
jgi:cell division protein FtsW (lipid II flippase)